MNNCIKILFLVFMLGAGAIAEPFKIAVLPDTQLYCQDYPQTFIEQTQWVVDNAAAENIAFLSHLGDIVNRGDDPNQWYNADQAMDILDGNIPYSICLGNHDLYVGAEKNDGSEYYVKYFSHARYANYSWYGGSSRNGFSHYQVFQANGRDFLHLNLEYMPDAEILLWAQRVLDAHPDMPTIYSTHAYIGDEAYVTGPEDPNYNTFWNSPSTDTIANISGEGQWKRLIANNDQIFMVLCGHSSSSDGAGIQITKNIFGNDVFQTCQDYQAHDNGGDGWMRLYEFDESANEIKVKTYSPKLDQYMTDPQNEFALSIDFAARFNSFAKREAVPTVQAANIKVKQYGTGNEPTDIGVWIPEGQKTAMFNLCDPNDDTTPNSNRGDYHPQIGSYYADDMEDGIFMAAIAQNGRIGEHYNADVSNFLRYHTASIGHGATANWLAIHTTGEYYDRGTSTIDDDYYYAGGQEDNVNIGAAYFPFSGGWTAGYVCNLDNNGDYYLIKGSENIVLGEQLVNAPTEATELSMYTSWNDRLDTHHTYTNLRIPGVDSRYDGVLLTCGGKNEDNYAVAVAANDGSGWVINVRDNGSSGREKDPYNFVYIPYETPGIAAGTLSSKGGIFNGSVDSNGFYNFTTEHVTTGTIRLTIDGHTPETGTLIVTGSASNYGIDNFVVYEPEESSWLIYVYDLNNSSSSSPGANLQDTNDECVNFAFIPFENPPAAPGKNRGFDTTTISAADFSIVSNGDISVNQIYGSVRAEGKRNFLSCATMDRGDFGMVRNGARLYPQDGVLFATIRQKNRQELGDSAPYNVVVSSQRSGWIAMHNTSGNEYNADFAAAFFPLNADYNCGHVNSDATVTEGYTSGLSVSLARDIDPNYAGRYEVSLEDVTTEDGILFASAQCNNDRTVNVVPVDNKWVVEITESEASADSKIHSFANDFGYLYIPYSSSEFILGRVSADGDVVDSNGSFTVAKESTGIYRISVQGCSPADGMLVLNSYGSNADGPERVLIGYEDDGDDFIVYTLNILADLEDAPIVTDVDSDFVFGYVPFDEDANFSTCRTTLADFSEFASEWLSEVDSSVYDYDSSNQIDYVDLVHFVECWLK